MAYLKMVPSVRAAGNEDTKASARMMKPNELDIYFEPTSSQVVEPSKKPSFLFEHVSDVRKYLWRFSGDFKNFYNKTSLRVSSTKEKVESVYDNAISDPITLVRPGCIATAFVVGAVLPGRGKKKFLRLITGSATGTAAAAIAYPKTASEISVKVYNKSRSMGVSLVEYVKKKNEERKVITQNASRENEAEPESIEAKSEVSNIEQEIPPENVIVENDQSDTHEQQSVLIEGDAIHGQADVEKDNHHTALSADSSPVENLNVELENIESHENKSITNPDVENQSIKNPDIENNSNTNPDVDYGQSNPEDKDMYSTRQ